MGTISYAGSGPNSRDTHLFIALDPTDEPPFGGELWETPVGQVIEWIDHVKQMYSYGDDQKLPLQQEIYEGREYIEENFPLTDSFEECKVERLGKKNAPQNVEVIPNFGEEELLRVESTE